MLDIRWVIGGLFTVLGALLAGYGLVRLNDVAMRPTGLPVTFVWGLVLLAFGLLMLWRGRRSAGP